MHRGCMNVDQLILKLIESHEVEDQAGLLALLKRQGHELTQSTLSRHLKKLSVTKREGRYRRLEPGAPELPEATLLEAPPNLFVIKTAQGFAPALAYLLDERIPRDLVAGTVAGEDTVFVALANPDRRSDARSAIRKLLGIH